MKFRVNEQVADISGCEVHVYKDYDGVFFAYQGNEIRVASDMSISSMNGGKHSISITHRKSDECIEIDNNSENIRVIYMNKIADPARTIRISTHDLRRHGENAPIKFAERDGYGTNEGFRIYPLSQPENQSSSDEDSGDQNDSLTGGELKNAYDSDSSGGRSYEDIEEMLKSSIYATRIVNGGQRTVYEVDVSAVDMLEENDGSIVKIAHNSKGVQANKHEMQTWQSVKSSEYRKFFCPITSIGPSHKYVVMKEADMDAIGLQETGDFRKKVTDALDVADDAENVSPMGDGWDIFSANVGMYDGRPVLVDYPYGGNIRPDL